MTVHSGHGGGGRRRAGTGAAQKRGRPRQGEERPKELTVLERQVDQSTAVSLAQLPTACDVGSKKNSKGFKETLTGYKLPIDTADGDIPVTAILTSASLHDRQAAIPLMRLSGKRVTYRYDLADAAYVSGVIRAVSRQEGHVTLIDHNARRGEKIAFAPPEAERYQARRPAEQVNSLMKDNHGGRHVRVRGAPKVYTTFDVRHPGDRRRSALAPAPLALITVDEGEDAIWRRLPLAEKRDNTMPLA